MWAISVTDEEIDNGLLQDPKRDEHCLCFVRNLTNINMKHDKAWRFIDKLDTGDVDNVAQSLLSELKEKKILRLLSSTNIFNYEIPWSDTDGVNTKDHDTYLKKFCDTVEKEILRLVDIGLANKHQVKGDSLYEEVLEHAHQGIAKCERFHGRMDVLSDIKVYLTSSNDQPFVIYGESGCGKTSIMAKAALCVSVNE